MQKLPPESWCDHEFVVQQKRGTTTEKHVIAIYDGENAIVDEVASETGRLLRKTIRINDDKEAEEYNGLGQVSVTRVWGYGQHGTIFCDERGVGSIRAEKRSVFTNDGRCISVSERLYCGAATQSEAESRYNPDGSPASTTTNTFDQAGRIRKREQTTWFSAGRPAIVEYTEFDINGNTLNFVKTMHTTSGSPLWQEKTYYPENSAKPSKKELIVFSAKSPKEGIVDISEYHPDGSIAKHILSKLVDATKQDEKKIDPPPAGPSTAATTAQPVLSTDPISLPNS